MANTGASERFAPAIELSFDKIQQAAQSDWLSSAAIYVILRNHRNIPLAIGTEPPKSPPSGSLLLFDRRVLKQFRKDGHIWKKKNDGKAVQESHEKLKVGKFPVLRCCYAHGEENEDFQRRIYWMLEKPLARIVLVHYLEVKRKRKYPSSFNNRQEPERENAQSGDVREDPASLPSDPPFSSTQTNTTVGQPSPNSSGEQQELSDPQQIAGEWQVFLYDDQFDSLDDLLTQNRKQTTENDSPANEVGRVLVCKRPKSENLVNQVQYADTADKCGDIETKDLLIRFFKFLCVGTSYYVPDIVSEVSPSISKIHAFLKEDNDNKDQMLRLTLKEVKEQLFQKFLKEKLFVWILNKSAEGGKGACVLDEDGQGVLHLAAALGYDWAIESTLTAGVDINFSDLNGWTALHWAARYGREWIVKLLIHLGANPEARSNPTPEHRSGQTPADLASAIGNKAIAEYLEQRHSTSCPSSLNLDALLNFEGYLSDFSAG